MSVLGKVREKGKALKRKIYDPLKQEKSPAMQKVRQFAQKHAIPAFPNKKEVERFKVEQRQYKEAQKKHQVDIKKWEAEQKKQKKAIEKGEYHGERLYSTQGLVINDISKPEPPKAPKPPKTPLFSETLGESTKRMGLNIGEKVVAKIEKRKPRIKTAPSYKARLGLEKPKPVSMASIKTKKGKKKGKAWGEEDFDF